MTIATRALSACGKHARDLSLIHEGKRARLSLPVRKPEPAFYRLACERNAIRPEEAVFLDDLGL
jgi:HAD superfamily hydrolase (TIGR01509 family)